MDSAVLLELLQFGHRSGESSRHFATLTAFKLRILALQLLQWFCDHEID
jgi:hypothetical protein